MAHSLNARTGPLLVLLMLCACGRSRTAVELRGNGDSPCVECLPDECGAHPPRCGTPTEGGYIYCGDCPECVALEQQILDELESFQQCTVGVDDCVLRSGVAGPCDLVGCGFFHSSSADPSQIEPLVQAYGECIGLGFPNCSCGGPAPRACIAGRCQVETVCGTEGLSCARDSQVCVGAVVPVGGEVIYYCADLPSGCDAERTCNCLTSHLCIGEASDCHDISANTVHCSCDTC